MKKFQSAPDEILHVQELLEQEKAAEIAQFTRMLEEQSPAHRKRAGKTWYPVELRETGYGLGDYPFVIVQRHDQTPHQFGGGKTVRLFSNQNESEQLEAQGVVHFVQDDKMKVIFYANELPDWVDDGRLGVDLLFDANSYREMERALKIVQGVDSGQLLNLRNILLGYAQPGYFDLKPIELPRFNESQQTAINQIVKAKDVALVHGPPGTGKTTTLIGAMQQLVANGERLLVCAPSNAAVDLLTERAAAAGMNAIRLGHLSRIDESLFANTLEGRMETHEDTKNIKRLKKQAEEYRRMAGKYKRKFGKTEREQRKLLYQEARQISKDAVNMEDQLVQLLLNEAQVVLATLVGSSHRYLHQMDFDTVLIDEAAQALEPATWIPILKARKVVLAGDPCQLPPTVKHDRNSTAGLSVTLLEKALKRVPEAGTLLQTQYRMHETLMGYSNQWFYENALKADAAVATHRLPLDEGQPILEFVDMAGTGFEEEKDPDSQSLFNTGEAEVLRKHLEALLDALGEHQSTTSFGVISPYKAQVIKLQDVLQFPEDVQRNLTVNTVDSFQGQERDVIYLSLVRSNEDGQIGFLSDYRRMNVAMTRARKKLVVIGDSATIGQDAFYEGFLAYCEKHEAYFTAWEWL